MTLQIAVFSLLVFLFLLRLPSAVARGSARPAWIASGLGLVGLLALGVAVPIPVLDSWLGGVNLWDLLGALSTVAAFWYFRRALQLLEGRDARTGWPWPLLAMLAVIAGLFFTIPLGRTDVDFVDSNVSHPGLFAYLTAYLVALSAITASSAWIVRRRARSVYLLFICGYLLCSAAAATDIGYTVSGLLAPGSPGLRLGFLGAFNTMFYPGIFLLALGFCVVYARQWAARVKPHWRVGLALVAAVRARMAAEPALPGVRGAMAAPDPVGSAYDELVRIMDLSFLENIQPTRLEALAIGAVEGAVARRADFAAELEG